jgi:hypothetical protein
MGDAVNKNAAPAVANLKSQINGLPPDNSVWRYLFDITVTGRVPRLPKIPGGTEDVMLASGGQLPRGEGAFLGDGPGGVMTPYTEYVTPDGYVINAKMTRELIRAGLLNPNGRRLAGGGMLGPAIVPIEEGIYNPAPSPIVRTPPKPSPGGRVGAPRTPGAPAPEEEAEAVASGLANQVTGTIQQNIAGALVPAQQAAVSAAVQQNTTLKEIRDLLQQLINATPTARDELSNAQFYSSLGS